MNQTASSDFEQTRQRLLAEIEARATRQGGKLTLQEWLRAAEEVMPDTKPIESSGENGMGNDDTIVSLSADARRAQRDGSVTGTRHESHREDTGVMAHDTRSVSRKTLFFSFFIASVILLLLTAAGALAYLHLSKRVDALTTTTAQIQTTLQQIAQGAPTGEGPDRLSELAARIDSLEKRLSDMQGAAATAAPSEQVTEQVRAELDDANVVTEAVLDAKLDQFSRRIEQALDKRFATLMAQLKSLRSQRQQLVAQTPAKEEAHAVKGAGHQAEDSNETTVPPPVEPAPPVQPGLKPASAQHEKQTHASASPLSGEVWLAAQPAGYWTLQLASVLDRDSLVQLKHNKRLEQAEIVRQKRSGRTFYVLVLGSFSDKAEARRAAETIRSQTGINPWIRPVRDLQKKLP